MEEAWLDIFGQAMRGHKSLGVEAWHETEPSKECSCMSMWLLCWQLLQKGGIASNCYYCSDYNKIHWSFWAFRLLYSCGSSPARMLPPPAPGFPIWTKIIGVWIEDCNPIFEYPGWWRFRLARGFSVGGGPCPGKDWKIEVLDKVYLAGIRMIAYQSWYNARTAVIKTRTTIRRDGVHLVVLPAMVSLFWFSWVFMLSLIRPSSPAHCGNSWRLKE